MFEIETGKKARPIIGIVYGEPGVGKTRLAASFGKAVVFDLEKGSQFLDVSRVVIEDYAKLIEAFKWVATQNFETVIIDSLTIVDHLCQRDVMLAHPNWDAISDGDYGAGYVEVKQRLTRIINGCEYLRNNGKNVIIVAHSKVRPVKNPTQDEYERVEFEVNDKMINTFNGISDITFYLRRKVAASKNKVVSNGTRQALLTDRGGHIAKNRLANTDDMIEFPEAKSEGEQAAMYANFWKEITNV